VLRRFISTGTELRTPVTKDEIVSEVPFKLKCPACVIPKIQFSHETCLLYLQVARQLNINIHPDNLHLSSPLSSLGEFELPLRLPQDIPRPEGKLQWTLNVKIRRK
jgi:large subunit ribosomal protein L9